MEEPTSEELLEAVKYWREVEKRLRELQEYLEEGGTSDGMWGDVRDLANEAGRNAEACWSDYEGQRSSEKRQRT